MRSMYNYTTYVSILLTSSDQTFHFYKQPLHPAPALEASYYPYYYHYPYCQETTQQPTYIPQSVRHHAHIIMRT